MVKIPAEGERAAICGYNSQYRISAFLVLHRLQERNLEWIRIADLKGGRLDDFQIGSDHRVDAYQMKWSEYPDNFTFNDLTAGSKEKPSLILQLAEGWKELSRKYPSSHIIVHLITNKTPSASTSQNMPAENPAPAKKHFAGFIEQCWKPIQKIPIDSDWEFVPEWRNTWNKIRKESYLSESDFKTFVRNCELEFRYDIAKINIPTTREQIIIKQDLDDLTLALFDMVADPEYIIELTRKELLTKLGWKGRLEYINPHEFPIDENLYQPIEETVEKIISAIEELPGGYIAVLGSPGSGKSTTLTKTLRDSSERVVFYYAFVPDAQDPQTLRGESVNFLHDIVLKLEELGFHEGEGICGFEREVLLKKFHSQIQKLHEDWKVTGTKTIILIDGLDHIEREQHPDRSLLEDLPVPSQVLEGVYFILGSQTDLPFPSRVQASVRNRERRIEMQPLKRQSVFNILDKSERKYSSLHKEKIFALCAGHPLSLAYLLNRLSEASNDEEIENILESTETYKGNIEEQYHVYWKQIENDYELVDLLGLLSRIRGAIEFSWVNTWGKESVVSKLKKNMGHYFKRETPERWYFFHNSYRLFLNEKTAESYPGEFDFSKDNAFHSKLAEKCANSPEGSCYRWEQLYHLYLAGKHESVLKLVSQEWFRNQFFLYRPVDAIKNDLKLALKSLETCNDPVALTRIELIDAELDQREFHLSEYKSKLISLLLDLDKSEIAVEYIRDGNRLRIDQTEALQLCIKLKSCGLYEEAKKVFELSEPLDLLYQRKSINNNFQDKNISLIEHWAKAAIHFQNINDITRTIRNLHFDSDRFQQLDADTATYLLQKRILFNVGLELLNEERWEDLELLISVLGTDIGDRENYWFWIHAHVWRNRTIAGDPEKAQYYLQKVLDKIDHLNLNSEKIVFLAEGIYRILSDSEKTKELLKKVSQPKVRTDLISPNEGLNPFIQRFSLNRILYALGSQEDPKEIVPDTQDSRYIGIVKFEQAICSLARIWADSWKNEDCIKLQFEKEILPLLRLFNKNNRSSEERLSWYPVKGLRNEFYGLLVQTIAQHGSEAIDSLRILFEKEWNNNETSIFWPSELRRHVVMSLWKIGINKSWTIAKLNDIEVSMMDGKNIFESIEECQKQAEAFILLGEKETANDLLDQILKLSFGVGFRKDYQLDSWIEWLNSINNIEPDKTAGRIEYFAQAISELSEVADDGSMRSAANELLAVTFRWSPRKAISLFYWFFENEVIWYEDSIVVLLQESLNSDNPPSELVFYLVADFLIPIATTAYEDLVINLIDVTAKNYGNNKAVEIARDVNSKVNIYALPSTRPKWRRGIAKALIILGIDLESVNLTVTDLQADEKNDYSHDILKLKDGKLLVKEQVITMVSSVSDLLDLLNRESEDSSFRWKSIVENLIQNLDSRDVYLLVGTFDNKYQSVHIFSILSRRLYAIGDAQGAWELGEKALNMSGSLGWITRHDGGTRISAFEALAKANPTKARHLAYKTLLQDLVDPHYSFQNIIFDLQEILPLITDNIPIKEIWNELESYVHTLFESLKLNSKGLCLDSEYDLDTPSRALSDFLVSHINHNINVIAQSSKRICGELLLKDNTDIQKAISEYLEKNESYQENILQLFDAVVIKKGDAISSFESKIMDLSKSPSYEIRRISQNLCKTLGFQITPNVIFTPLPPIYQLDLSSISTPVSRLNIDNLTSEPLPDPENLFEMILPYDLEIMGIAHEAFLPEINVLYRASQIIRKFSPEDYWSRVGEQNLRHTYESARLRITYKRPRALIARQSIFHIIAELIDTDWALGSVELSEIERLMRFYDPDMILSEPLSRPAYIAPVFGLEHRDTSESLEKWCGQIEDDAFAFESGADDDIVILAENTELKCLEWKTPTEIRQSVTCLSGTPKLESEHNEQEEIFQSIFRGFVSEYPELQTETNDHSIVLRNNPRIYDSPGGEWLALNPKVGNSLGWNLSEEGFFRWVNGEGEIMVESVWWMDGNINQGPPHFDDEVGEGWLVLASKEAFNSIKSTFGPPCKKIRLERSFASDGQVTRTEKQYEKTL
ncbi:hypothetical protein [Methanosarcina barkeri]|uniref:Uncharacterized protein n=1 Tax=Methanosarcina barkeri 227 TaxID=1434106 RepID=A0A0E3R068_METBA|nr:hypothetical protein [Methanosarcina barkeri]AKB57703.1 hypothetical protein MSBR2_1187 [Methanosarcina barkeri 227]